MDIELALFNIADTIHKSRYPSLGLGYIAAFLRKYSYIKNVHILEGNIFSKIENIKPNIIGMYSVTQNFNDACSVAKLLKTKYPGLITILGGYHITSLPHILPDCFDIGVLGEGEETMKELLEAISKNGLDQKRMSEIEGIVFKSGDKNYITPRRNLINDLDSIPHPERNLFARTSFPSMITSRGCPYNCIFCASSIFWGKTRFHSAEYIVEEIEQLVKKYNAVHISIWDDLFIAHKQRFQNICDLVDKKMINKKISFSCALRSNLVDKELCSNLKRMGVNRVSIGFESGSQKILNRLKCGSVNVEDHIKAVELCRAYGLYITGTFMIGNPEEDESDLLKTLELIKRLKLNGGGNIFMTTPYPGTALWDYSKEKGYVNDRMDFNKIGVLTTDFSDPDSFCGIILTDKISKDRFFKLAQKIQKESNRYFLTGLLHKNNFSFKAIKFIIARPNEVFQILKFFVKSLLCQKSSIMGRYIYYKKSNKIIENGEN